MQSYPQPLMLLISPSHNPAPPRLQTPVLIPSPPFPLLFCSAPCLQVLLWYASAYEVFLWAYGGASGRWRYGLDWQKAKSAGALMLVPVIVFIFFCLW